MSEQRKGGHTCTWIQYAADCACTSTDTAQTVEADVRDSVVGHLQTTRIATSLPRRVVAPMVVDLDAWQCGTAHLRYHAERGSLTPSSAMRASKRLRPSFQLTVAIVDETERVVGDRATSAVCNLWAARRQRGTECECQPENNVPA